MGVIVLAHLLKNNCSVARIVGYTVSMSEKLFQFILAPGVGNVLFVPKIKPARQARHGQPVGGG